MFGSKKYEWFDKKNRKNGYIQTVVAGFAFGTSLYILSIIFIFLKTMPELILKHGSATMAAALGGIFATFLALVFFGFYLLNDDCKTEDRIERIESKIAENEKTD